MMVQRKRATENTQKGEVEIAELKAPSLEQGNQPYKQDENRERIAFQD